MTSNSFLPTYYNRIVRKKQEENAEIRFFLGDIAKTVPEVIVMKKKADASLAETMGAEQKIWHEKPISKAYRALDNDLATDNLENDIPMADLQDL